MGKGLEGSAAVNVCGLIQISWQSSQELDQHIREESITA